MGRKRKQLEPPPAAPDHLSERSKALWGTIVPRRARSPERLELLIVALEARDRMNEARLAVNQTGMTTTTATTKAVHLHPLLRVEKEARAQFLQAWAALSLEWDCGIDGMIV